MTRRLFTFLAVIAAALSLAGGPAAYAGDSTAVAINTKDDSSLVDIVFDIERIVQGHDVDSGNAAAAVASCNSCETVAIAIQVVLASGNPVVVAPENLAIAMNVDCNLCQTLAEAYQFVSVTPEPLTFTKAGKTRIQEIQKELHELEKSGLPIDQIHTRVGELTAEVQTILKTELVQAPSAGGGDEKTQAGTETTPADTGTETAPTDTETTPAETGTETTPSDTGTSTTPSETGTETTPSDTGTSTTPTDTGTSTTP